MAELEVDPKLLGALASELRASSERIQGALDELAAQLGTLSAQWTGEAADAFRVAEAAWTASMTTARLTLARAAAVLSTAVGGYTSTETSVIERCR